MTILGGGATRPDRFDATVKTIGSIRNNQINYPFSNTFFTTSDYMPLKSQEAHKKVQDDIDRDLLGTKREKWLNSVEQPKSLQDKSAIS